MKGAVTRIGIRKMDYGKDKRIFYKRWRGEGLLSCPFHRIEVGLRWIILHYRRTIPPGMPPDSA